MARELKHTCKEPGFDSELGECPACEQAYRETVYDAFVGFQRRGAALHECGFCEARFPTTSQLYDHQRTNHDPDGIMFSELGLPK